MKTVSISVFVIILIGLGAWFVSRSNDAETAMLVSFEDCVVAGYPVMKSYPRRCAGPNGQLYVEDVDTGIIYDNASIDDIRVVLPFPNAVVGKSFKVIGEARAWYFEGSFPIEVLDASGAQLAIGIAQAQGDWMTADFVPFEADITIPDTYIGPATLVLHKDNPSGLPEHDASMAFPITVEYWGVQGVLKIRLYKSFTPLMLGWVNMNELTQEMLYLDYLAMKVLEVKKVKKRSSKGVPVIKPFFESENTRIYKDDILVTKTIPKGSIDLIITSPPYNVDIHYNSHKDDLSYDEYLSFTKNWIEKCYELAKSEGRFCLNIPLDKNKGGQKSVGADITKIAKEVGWRYHSTIIWNEGNISRRTAWGSFMSASAPYVIAPVELILVLYKDSWKKTTGSRVNDITKKEFMDWTNGVWTFSGQSKKGAGGHPAPFPVELPRRCIKLFSFIGDTVLDPFLGSGSTLLASKTHKRKGVGIEIDKKYCDIAVARLKNLQIL